MSASPAPSQRPWRRRIINRYTVGVLALALLGAAGFAAWRWMAGRQNPREQYQIVTVQRGDIEDLVTATGTVQPRDYVDVGAQVSGQLKKIHVEVGSVVQAGDLLAEIDPTVLLANVDARRAGLRNLRATLLDREAQLSLAELQFTRQKNLMAADATTQEALQQAEASLRSARAQLAALKAQIEQSESTLRADEANLGYARILAPISGTVVSITARQGQTLNANQQAPTVLRVADLSTMTVQTQVSEADVSKLRQGMRVYFTTLGSQGRRWYGALRKVEPTPTVTNNVVLYNALFDVPNDNRALMTSMTAQVFFIAASAKDALYVPAAAVVSPRGGSRRGTGTPAAAASDAPQASAPVQAQAPSVRAPADRASAPADAASRSVAWGGPSAPQPRGPRQATVKVIDAQGRIEERQVTLGVSNRVQVQVLSGLQEGEEVVAGLKLSPAGERNRSAAAGGPGGMPPGGGLVPAGGLGGAPRGR